MSADPNVKFTKTADTSKKNVESFPYRKAIGSLMFLMVTTRPHLAFIVNMLS